MLRNRDRSCDIHIVHAEKPREGLQHELDVRDAVEAGLAGFVVDWVPPWAFKGCDCASALQYIVGAGVCGYEADVERGDAFSRVVIAIAQQVDEREEHVVRVDGCVATLAIAGVDVDFQLLDSREAEEFT